MKNILACTTCFFAFVCSIHAQRLYSITSEGGTHGFGVIFSYDASSSTYTKLVDFDSTNGSYADGSLVQAANGKLYGMTLKGGSSDVGVIYSFDPANSVFTKLMDFDYTTNGGYPTSTFVEVNDGKLYGMTSQGGKFGSGVIFSYDPSSSLYTKLLDFDNSNGNAPHGSLIKGTNGKLYGMTTYGGTGDFGVIFSYDPSSSTYTKLKDFDYYSDGGHPYGSLLQASDGKFYGMTYDGGSSQFGVIFSFDASTSTYLNLKDFEYDEVNFVINGAYPYGSLIQARDGLLYGMTPDGGRNGYGVIFSIEPSSSTFKKLTDFDLTGGTHPYGDLKQTSDGKLYGMTYEGGISDKGVIFSFDLADSAYTKVKDYGGPDGGNPYIASSFIAVPESGPVPVTLISFTGKNHGNTNQLLWQVENELNLNYYELQRGIDAQNFKALSQIKAEGNNHYAYDDLLSTAASRIYYYRLKNVDRDGKFKYSTVIKIRTNLKGFVIVNPNPFKNQLVVHVESPVGDKMLFIISDLNGRQLYKQNKLVTPGANVVEINEVSALSKGAYLLTITGSQQTQSIKILKGN